jgi:hypothetical protein
VVEDKLQLTGVSKYLVMNGNGSFSFIKVEDLGAAT